jgi:hypothetical protein
MARTRKTQEKDVITRLADAGEEALHKIVDLPGGKALADALGGIRERLDEVATRLRALDPLERRVTSLEKRLDSLEKPRRTAVRSGPRSSRATSSRASATRRKTS